MQVNIEHEDDVWNVSCPYDEDFIQWAKENGGTWAKDDRVWVFQDSDFTEQELEKELKVFYPQAFR